MIKFKCNDCGSEKYKIVYWKLKDKPDNIGVYVPSVISGLSFWIKTKRFVFRPKMYKLKIKDNEKRKGEENKNGKFMDKNAE